MASVPRLTVVLKIGEQLTERGWFFDTDAVGEVVQGWCDRLGERPWTELFSFRPTFELVARHLYAELGKAVPQLAFVELRDLTFGTSTRYSAAGQRTTMS